MNIATFITKTARIHMGTYQYFVHNPEFLKVRESIDLCVDRTLIAYHFDAVEIIPYGVQPDTNAIFGGVVDHDGHFIEHSARSCFAPNVESYVKNDKTLETYLPLLVLMCQNMFILQRKHIVIILLFLKAVLLEVPMDEDLFVNPDS